MKRALAILLTAMMLLSMVPTAAFAEEYGSEQLTEMSAQPQEMPSNPAEGTAFDGQGSEEDPYKIDSEDSLKLLASLVNEGSEEYAEACYILVSDISLTGAWTPIGSEEQPFCGSFDGNGKKISGLSAGSGAGCFGLFGAAKDARLFGIALDGVNIEASGYDTIGAVVGYMQGGSLGESYAEGTVNGGSGKYCGGLAGCAEGAEIVDCFSAVEMEADGYVGGIAGFGCDGTTIDRCYNIGFIYSNVKGAFGSVLGNTGENIDLSDCYCIDTTDKGAVFLTREEAADKNSFKGFDFDGVWFVDKDSDYPYPVLKANPSKCDAKWAPDTTVHSMGYVDNEEHNTPLSKNAMLESNSKDSEMYTSRYIIPNLPAVRDQDPYGTCWAHAILAAAETNLIKKGLADPSVNLSELQFVWFHHNGAKNAAGEYEDPLNNFGGDRNYSRSTNYGVWGGDNYYAASKSAASWMGLINEDEITAYSETNAKNIVNNGGLDYSYAFSKDAYHLENVKMIPTNSGTDAVKKAILKYGAICVSYMSDSGYNTSYGKYYFSHKGDTTNHAVSIVGWDDTVNKNLFYDKNNDAVPENDGAWIVRNSWGSGWGDGGYFYMSYESTYVTDGNRSFFAFDFEPAESYEKCYQYDGSACYVKAFGYSTSKPAAANIFTASGNDIISAVSFWMEDNADLNYTVKVYTNLTNGSNPTSGTLAATVSGQTDYAGYYTVALPEQVSVNSGTKFSVVLQITNSTGETILFPCDVYKYYNDNDYYDAHSEAGQSFLSSNGTSWTDKSANNGGNFRIKAFTTDNPSDPRPAAPTISVSGASGKMVLSWSAVSNAASYTVYRAITPDGSYSEVGTTTSAGYTDTTAVSGTVYYYRVTAKSVGGNLSRYSNTASGLVGTQTSFVISYDANGGSGAPAYQIKTAGTALTLSEAVPTHEGYTFLGWSEDSAANTADYAAGASFTKNADTTLYAVWLDGILVNSIDELESEHNYANNLDQKWYFTDSEALSITLTFDSKTKTEASYDFILIYDGNKNLIGKYSGSELSSQTVTIPGNTVCIQLVSDVSYNYYGFKISSYQIEKNTPYTVKFVNHDGTVLQTGSWYYGETPEYTGETPTKASTEQYNYFFKGWSPAISAVTGDVTYTAQFREIVRQYTVTFKNDDGKVLMNAKFDYGSTPAYTGATPTKASTAQYTYTFTGWSPAISTVTTDATYTAQYSSAVRQYTVKFVNGSTVLQTNALNYGATPAYTGATPTKASTAQYTYTFTGWSPAVSAVTGDVTYTAQFKETVRQYTVTFKNHDGTVLKTSKLDYGATPSYTGTPAKNSTAQYTYTFTGWSPAISTVTGDATYTAQFKETLRQYTVTFKNDDGTVLKTSKLDYGATPSYTGTPTKASTAQYSYTFTGWSPAVSAVTGDATYTAQFKETARQYTVTFKNDDGTVLKTSKLDYGATPTYSGTPTKASTAQYSYTFTGWSPAVTTVTGDATYTAQYSSAVRQYTVKFVNGSTVLQSNVLSYGATPTYTGATPTKAETAQYSYTFKGWSPAVSTVTGDVTYTAQFNETVKQYTVTFKNHDGTVLKASKFDYGATPTYTGTPTKASTAQYTYTFTGWSPAISTVTGDVTYTAQFKETLRQYTVTFKNDDGTVLKTSKFDYGATPSYTGTPTKASTAQYSYTFTGWSPAVTTVTADATYTAQYSSAVRQYTVKFVNGSTVLQTNALSYGATPAYTGATPTKAETAQYTYTFTGWSPAVSAVTGDVTYTAQFNETVKQYTVTFKNHDGTVLKTSKLDYGATPSYTGTPTKASTAQYTYTFTGWSPAISAVTGDVTYTAQFKETVRQYTVKFVNGSTVLQTYVLNYGTTPSYTGATPTKASTAQYSYTFKGWSPAVTTVTGDATYTAQFNETVRQYTVTFKNDDGTVLKTSKFNYGATPTYSGTPTKASTAQYSYTFTGWSPAVTTVTADATYTAQYSSAVRQYTVKFVNGSTVLQTNALNYGATPAYTGATPTKASTAQYSYTFTGWSPAVSAVTGDATYTAQFKETVRQYTLTVNYVSADTGFKTPAAHTANVNYGASYSVNSPSVAGYVCDKTAVTGTMGTGATVTVTYYKVGFTWNGTSAVVNAGTVLVNQAAAVSSQQTKAPTCTEPGTTKYTASCTAQGQTFTDVKYANDVSATNHAKKVHHDAVPATCLAAGNIEYYYCPDCKCYFTANMTATTAEGVVLAKLSHEYEFTANTAAHTVTATCKNGCNDAQVLTLTAPEGTVYDGNAKVATADKTTLGGAAVSAVSYFVKNAQGAWAPVNAAVNAGSYKATVSVGGATTEYAFTIAKATPEITVSCADIDADATPAPVCEVKGSNTAPVITYSADGVSYGTWDEVRGSADTYYVKAYLAATDNSEAAVAVASFNVSSGCAHINIISIREGRYLLYLNTVQVGYVTFTQKDGKWAINVEGKGYLSCDGSKVSYSSTPYYWTHNGCGFVVVKSETTGSGIKKTKNVTYYLSYGGEGKGYSLTKDATISVIMDIATGEQHTFAYRDNGDGTHTKYCTVCGKEYATTACTYDESTHCCRYCGHGDPTVKSVKANVTVNKTYNSSSWTRFWHGDYTYSVSITATANGDTVKSVQYSTNGSKWTTGTSFSQYKDVGTLYVRVTTGSGDTYNFVYQNGTTTPLT